MPVSGCEERPGRGGRPQPGSAIGG